MSGFSPIPNFTGVGAGQQFRVALNAALGGTAPITPVLGSATVAQGVNMSAAVASAAITDAALRTLSARATDRINFADYAGADPTGTNDNSSIISQALTDCRAQAKALYIPAGTFGIASMVLLQQGDRIYGDGYQSVLKYIGVVTSGFNPAVLGNAAPTGAISPPPPGAPLTLSNFRIVGPWNGTTVTTQGNGAMISLHALDSVIYDRLWVEYASNVGIGSSYCRWVTAQYCVIRYSARDGIQNEGSSHVRIIGCDIRFCDDNGISAHTATAQTWTRVSNVIIIGNRLVDTSGISCQGAQRFICSNNVIERPRQLGIEVAFVGASLTEGESAPLAAKITDNVITDAINEVNITGTPTASYISVGTTPPQRGSASASTAIPGSHTTITPLTWAATTTLALTNAVGLPMQTIDTNGNIQQVTTAGTTGASAPAWNATLGGTTTDGTAAWTNEGSGIVATRVPTGRTWVSGAYIIGAMIVDAHGNVQACTVSGTTGASAPAWQTAYAASTTDGGVTWECLGANTAAAPALPYGAFNSSRTAVSDTATPIGAGWSVEIANNICMRTLDATANLSYSQSNPDGNQFFTRTGFLNPLMGSEELITTVRAINFYSYGSIPVQLRHVRIAGNIFMGQQNGIIFGAGMQFLDAEVEGNHLLDFTGEAFVFSGPNIAHRIDMRNNLIDGDPFLRNRGTATGGAWQSGLATPAAIYPGGASGITFRGNRLRNLMQIANGGMSADSVIDGNMLFCQPTATGFNAANLGIGTVPQGGRGYMHIIEVCNPGAWNFGNPLNGPVLFGIAQPSSGTFVEGQFVANTAPVVTTGFVLLGWARLTTGSGNVSGTDWSPCWAAVAS